MRSWAGYLSVHLLKSHNTLAQVAPEHRDCAPCAEVWSKTSALSPPSSPVPPPYRLLPHLKRLEELDAVRVLDIGRLAEGDAERVHLDGVTYCVAIDR